MSLGPLNWWQLERARTEPIPISSFTPRYMALCSNQKWVGSYVYDSQTSSVLSPIPFSHFPTSHYQIFLTYHIAINPISPNSIHTASMASAEVPRLRLILDNATKNLNAEIAATVWNPADNLFGRLEISSKQDLAIERITLYLEGRTINKSNAIDSC